MTLLIEGKTKRVFRMPGRSHLVRVESKSDITAGDGAKRDSFPDKDRYATATTVAVFKLLAACDMATAFVESHAPTEFIAEECQMLPYEVVVRRVALGSYLKRNPHVTRGYEFPALVVEFYLKTTGRKFKGIEFAKDDPYIAEMKQGGIVTYRPDMPITDAGNGAVPVSDTKLYGKGKLMHPFAEMEREARKAFLAIEGAWRTQGCRLCDLKIEFGFTQKGQLVVADVVDNDSWRLFDADGNHLDKQRYRDGAEISAVAALYADVADRVKLFAMYDEKPAIILWRGSETDEIRPFMEAMRSFGMPARLITVTRSVHKAPEASLALLRDKIRESGAGVVIAFVGRSNGAGPVFAADTHVPVIAVPAGVASFPDDVWSSLRMPSDVPLLTVLDPGNAIQAALGILSARSPQAYMARRSVIEHHKLDSTNSPTLALSR